MVKLFYPSFILLLFLLNMFLLIWVHLFIKLSIFSNMGLFTVGKICVVLR